MVYNCVYAHVCVVHVSVSVCVCVCTCLHKLLCMTKHRLCSHQFKEGGVLRHVKLVALAAPGQGCAKPPSGVWRCSANMHRIKQDV